VQAFRPSDFGFSRLSNCLDSDWPIVEILLTPAGMQHHDIAIKDTSRSNQDLKSLKSVIVEEVRER
jgi:hypothetical protein